MNNRSQKCQRTAQRTGSLPVILPRLCSCDVHRGHFVDLHIQDIERFIHEEIKELSSNSNDSRKDRFTVFKKGFEMLIEESVTFKSLLSDINAEYLGVIQVVEKGQHQIGCMTRDLKRIVGERDTLNNYENRIADLNSKAEIIKANNDHLKQKVEQLKKENEKLSSDIVNDKSSQNLAQGSRILLRGLEMDEQTDVETLSSILSRLKAKVKAAQQDTEIKFRPKEQKLSLQKELQRKETIQHHVSQHNALLRERLGKLSIAAEAGNSSQDLTRGLYDVVIKALADYERVDSSRRRDPLQQMISTDEDDPLKKKESERLLAYIEHFNDLFDFGLYDAAAIHAASSPKGVLRTFQAMQRFKEVDGYDGPKSPLFLFCEVLMTTSISGSKSAHLQLSAPMSLECISCALRESGISLAIHWLNQPCIMLSLPLGDLLGSFCQCVGICRCQCQALAESVYRRFDAHRKVAVTLTRQGKHRAAIEYGRKHGDFNLADYKTILEHNPSVDLAMMLLQESVRNRKVVSGLSFCSIVSILLKNSEATQTVLVPFLEHVESTGVCDSRRLKYYTKDLIFLETISDNMNDVKWNKVVDVCFANGHTTLAVEILSTLRVRQALHHAAISSSIDYIS